MDDNLLSGLTERDLLIVGNVVHLAWVLQEELHQPDDVVAGRIAEMVDLLINQRLSELGLLLPEGENQVPLDGVKVGKRKRGIVRAA